MGQVEIAGRDVDTDVRLWTPDLRREASLVIGGLAAVFLLAGLIWYALAPGSAGTFLWVAIVLLVLLLLAEAAVLVTGIAREENVGPHWLSEPEAHRQTREPQAATPGAQARAGTPADEEVPAPPEIDLQCPECGEMFAVEDTGERPLATECPHCGASGHVNLEEPPEHAHEPGDAEERVPAGAGAGSQQAEEVPDVGEPEPDYEEISLECPACGTKFDVEDTGERPLRTECPGCGRSGKLS